jgi:hypothetical protein
MRPDDISVSIPMPVQIVIDDVGWWSGEDGHARQEPFRTGISRNHVVQDYEAVVRLGRLLGMRPQAAIALCEWDRDNLLRNVPTSTWIGAAWDNRKWVGPWLDEAASVLRENAPHVEVTLHALGHEYWTDGVFTRAEWVTADGSMRPHDQIMAHLDCCHQLLRRNGLGDMPHSFVPTAHYHCFGDGENGFASILNKAGIRFIGTPFGRMRQLAKPQNPLFGVDHGIMTVDRTDRIGWNAIGSSPGEQIDGPIIGLHWPNILHQNPDLNNEVVDRWVKYILHLGNRVDRILARDTDQFRTQLAYHVAASVKRSGTTITCTFGRVGQLGLTGLGETFTVKVASQHEVSFLSGDACVVSCSRFPDGGVWAVQVRPNQGVSECTIQIQNVEGGPSASG